MYLVPEVPVVPVVPENLISDILVSLAFQKYITPMVNSKKLRATLFRYLMYLVPEVPV